MKYKVFYNEDGSKEAVNIFEQHSGLVTGTIIGLSPSIDINNWSLGLYAEWLQYNAAMNIAAFGLRIGWKL